MKSTLNCCKIQVIFKRKEKLPNMFKFKDPLLLPYDLVSGVVYKYTCGRHSLFYYDETERYLEIRSGEHIGISPPSKESWIRDHFLQCDNNSSFDEFTILVHGKFSLRNGKMKRLFRIVQKYSHV